MRRVSIMLAVLLSTSLWAATSNGSSPTCEHQAQHLIEGPTFDGGYLVGVDYHNHTGKGTEAGYVCTGALLSYADHVAWGFHSDDDDEALNYTLGMGAVVAFAADLEITIPHNLVEVATNEGVSYTSVEALFHTAVHHETNHHFMMSAVDCYNDEWWTAWEWLWDGFATFSETLHNSSEMHRQNSSFYENSEAVNEYVNHTNRALTKLDHETGLLHGYLYAHNGGMPFVHNLTSASKDQCRNDTDPILILDEALAASPGSHDRFEDAFIDFALDVVRMTNLSWGAPGEAARDWTLWLDPLNATVWRGDNLWGTVQPWAFEAVEAPIEGGYEIQLNVQPGHELASYLLVHDGANWTEGSFTDSVLVPAGNHNEVVVVLVATTHDSVSYQLVQSEDRS